MSQQNSTKFPLSHVFGFVLSLVLTFIAIWLTLESGLDKTIVLTIIVVLAIFQAGLQLFMFMHMTESENGKIQVINIAYSFFIAVVIVVGSVWVMAFGHVH